MQFRLAPMLDEDWPEVLAIYRQGIATGLATFETEAPEWKQWDSAHLPSPRLAARSIASPGEGDSAIGWAALSRVSTRQVYSGVAEVSLYIAESARGAGIGTALLTELVRQSEAGGIWTLQAGIFPENRASIAVHEKCGFRVVGVREKLGRLGGEWRDVVLMERRSRTVGV